MISEGVNFGVARKKFSRCTMTLYEHVLLRVVPDFHQTSYINSVYLLYHYFLRSVNGLENTLAFGIVALSVIRGAGI